MDTTHTYHHGLNDMNNSHKELSAMEIEKRELYFSGVSVGAIIALVMLVGAYFLLW